MFLYIYTKLSWFDLLLVVSLANTTRTKVSCIYHQQQQQHFLFSIIMMNSIIIVFVSGDEVHVALNGPTEKNLLKCQGKEN